VDLTFISVCCQVGEEAEMITAQPRPCRRKERSDLKRCVPGAAIVIFFLLLFFIAKEIRKHK
jgi:hypothetical protein